MIWFTEEDKQNNGTDTKTIMNIFRNENYRFKGYTCTWKNKPRFTNTWRDDKHLHYQYGALLYKLAKDGLCILALCCLLHQTDGPSSSKTHWEHLYTLNYFKYSPTKQIFSHLQFACFAHLMKLNPTSASHG